MNLDEKERVTREVLPPDEVVEFTIAARQRNQTDRFFRYVDVESLMLQSPEWKRKYDLSGQEVRRQLVAAYMEELAKEIVDEDIQMKPDSFRILSTQYTPTEGTVIVEEKFAYSDFTEVKQYTYYLQRRERYWEIKNYTVTNKWVE